jgi:hypothetical protein
VSAQDTHGAMCVFELTGGHYGMELSGAPLTGQWSVDEQGRIRLLAWCQRR